jgi:quinol monooxygenase YgiN
MLEVDVKDGQLGAFEELMREMVEGTSAEPRTLAYEWYVSDDGKTVHLFEKYADSEAMISHVNGFLEKWAGRFMECVDFKRFVAYGDPSPAAREILDGWRATYMSPWGGFSRFA